MTVTLIQAAQQLYDDLFLRCNLTDQGVVPAQGALSTSPDIIPAGTVPVTKPEEAFANFQKDYGQPIRINQQNYIYVRGENLAPAQVDAQIHLYWGIPTILNWPAQWSKNALITERGVDHVTLTAKKTGDLVVGTEPFVWTPAPVADHYCMIARVVTPNHPNPIPMTNTVKELAKWVQENRAMAWRNLAHVDQGAPDWTQHVDYYQGEEAEEIHFILSTVNIPVGCEVAITCGTPGPNPLIVMDRTLITNGQQQDLGIFSYVPAGFRSTISYSFWSNGKPIPDGASIQLRPVYIPDADSDLARIATPVKLLGVPTELVEHRMKAFTQNGIGPVRGVVLGSHKTAFVKGLNQTKK